MQYVQANGLRFAYLEEGAGPLVLCLHGFPDTAYTWDRVMQELARAGYRAVAPFLRGYHPSELAGPYDADTLGRDVLALIEALGETSAIVIGHDWGASAAYSAAALGPQRVRLLVTVAVPHPMSVKPTPSTMWRLRHFVPLRARSAAAKLRADDFAYVDELVRRWSPSWHELPASETARVKEAFAEPGCAEAACAYYAAVSPKRPASHKLLITVPAVAFAGEHDPTFAPRKFELGRLCFTSLFEIVQVPGGHFMHREHPGDFITELLRILREHEARTR